MTNKHIRDFTARIYEALQPQLGDLLPPDMGEYQETEVMDAQHGKIEVYDAKSKRGFTITITYKGGSKDDKTGL